MHNNNVLFAYQGDTGLPHDYFRQLFDKVQMHVVYLSKHPDLDHTFQQAERLHPRFALHLLRVETILKLVTGQ